MIKYSKVMLLSSILVCSILSVINAAQENPLEQNIDIQGSAMVVLFTSIPFLITYLWSQLKANRNNGITVSVTATLISLFGLFAYVMYLAQGPSNPNSAGHMHVFLFPIIHAVIAVILIVVASLIGFILNRFNAKNT